MCVCVRVEISLKAMSRPGRDFLGKHCEPSHKVILSILTNKKDKRQKNMTEINK